MMGDVLSGLELARMGLGAAFIVLGLAFIAGGVIGLLRFPDFFTRLHACNVITGVGATLVLIGLAVVAPDGPTAIKIVLMGVLLAAVAPTIAHLTANAAHSAGLAPLAGPYTAPRPGAKRAEPPA